MAAPARLVIDQAKHMWNKGLWLLATVLPLAAAGTASSPLWRGAQVQSTVRAELPDRLPAAQVSSEAVRAANELGRIPILEYHLIGDEETRWQRQVARFRHDLELLYERGYRPISVAELVDRRIDLPAGQSPVVITFDDASPSQFRYIERDGRLEIDPTSALGVWRDFARSRPDWRSRAVFCLLSNAEEGRAFFGNKGIEGQRSEWRHQKLRFLAAAGFELCNHTLWHANLGRYDDAFVQEQIARAQLAIDSAVPGYRVRTFALPLGVFPRNPELARAGRWTDPQSGRVVRYHHDAILLVAGDPERSPYDPAFDPLRMERVQVHGDALERVLDRLETTRYVSDGDPTRVTAPAATARAAAAPSR